MSGTLSLMSEGVDSRLDEIHVKEESANEFIQHNIHIETPAMDENIEMEMDIKEEVVTFIQDPVPLIVPLNTEDSSGTLFKRDIDESVQILLRSANQVSTTEHTLEDQVDTEAEVGTDRELSPSPSKYMTRNVVRQELANPPPQVSSRRLCGQKRPYLTTLIGAKTHTCKNCSARFETKFKLREHNKWHTGEKRLRRRNRKTLFKCSVCEETFLAEIILTAHLKTHIGEKPFGSIGKGSLTVENVDPRGGPKEKYEEFKEMDYHLHHNSTTQAHSEDHSHQNLETTSSITHNVEGGSTEAEKKDLKDFYHDLRLCDADCETCVKYMRMLREHVRAAHAPRQPIQNALLVDPVHVPLTGQSSSLIRIKSEVEENIVKTDSSESEEVGAEYSDSDPNYNTESDSEIGQNDPDYGPSPSSTKKPRRQGQVSVKSRTSSQSRSPKTKKENLQSQQHFKCGECGKSFKLMCRLKEHMRGHTGEKPFKCDLCVKRFVRKSELIIHKRFHTGEKPFECEVCEKRFAQSSSLTLHNRIHTGEKPYKCDLCKKSFSQRAELLKHGRIHTGERPYICDVCAMRFKSSSHLNQHMRIRIHTGRKPFSCDVCEKSFTTSFNLTQHKTIHTGEKPYQCDQCEKSFKLKSHMTTHKKIHTKGKTNRFVERL